jgi:hypothetical protein
MDSDVKQVVGVYRNGRVEIDGPLDWPEGATVVVMLDGHAATHRNGTARPADDPDPEGDPSFHMMREEDWPTTPEGIAALIERWKEHEPPILTPEEEADLAAWRAEMKRFNIEAVRKQMGLPE